MSSVSCLICNKRNTIRISGKVKYNRSQNVVMCKNCGLVYLDPQKSKTEYDSYYRHDYYQEYMDYFSSHEDLLKWWNDQGNYILEKSHPFIKPGAIVLEIGCAGGGILNVFKNSGYPVTGLEVSKTWIDFAKDKYEIMLHDKSTEDILQDHQRYDIIILSHFVEHLLDPKSEMLSIKKLLAPNGIIYIEVPNIRDINKKLSIKDYFCFPHTYYFSPITLKYFLYSCGFQINYSDVGREVIRYIVTSNANDFNEDASKTLQREPLITLIYLMFHKIKHIILRMLKKI